MASENIKLNKTNQANFAASNGYFYTMDYAQDGLLQKTDDGNTAFTYPLDTLLSYAIKSLEYDGVYFWSLEKPDSTSVAIRKWKIDNYICKLQQTFSLNNTTYSGHYFQGDTFSIDHYHTSLTATASGGTTTLEIGGYTDSPTISGATLHLGPNSDGDEEEVVCSTALSGVVTLVSGTFFSYDVGDEVNYFNNIWFFNNYNGTSTATGALYKFNGKTGAFIKKYPGAAYKSITASTFYKVDVFTDYPNVDALIFIKGTNALFVNINEYIDGTLKYYGSMVMDNIQSDKATIIPIYDLAIDRDNVYRLQDIVDGGSSAWSLYSYLLSPLDSFVTSISLSASPAIIAANNLSISSIVAVVRDQFLEPIIGRTVTFSENGTGSLTGGTTKVTNAEGLAQTEYKAGTTAQEVKITAVVEQTN